MALTALARLVGLDQCGEPGAFVGREEFRMRRRVGHEQEHQRRQDEREDSGDEEYPLPAGETESAVEIEQSARDQRARAVAQRATEREDPRHARLLRLGKPERQIVEQRRIEPGLRHAEREPQSVEQRHGRREGEQQGRDAPARHDAGDPGAGAEAMRGERARHFEHQEGREEQ